jgi:hypothetical protein
MNHKESIHDTWFILLSFINLHTVSYYFNIYFNIVFILILSNLHFFYISFTIIFRIF